MNLGVTREILAGSSSYLPEAAVIVGEPRIGDMIWIWEVFGAMISPES